MRSRLARSAAALGLGLLVMFGAGGPVQAATSPFTDIAGTPFEADIDWLYAEGITRGCAPDRFCPDSPLSRGELAAFFVRMFGLPSTSTDFFTDDEDSSFESEINRLAAAGITVGCTATTYCPKASVRRDEFATFLVRAIPLTDGAGRNYFRDDDGSTHEANVDRVAAAGLTSGCAKWRYCGDQALTRGQTAALLHRVDAPLNGALPYPAPPISTFHVAVTGTNTDNDCIDPGNPCRTIKFALALTLDGDSIAVGPGTFTEEAMTIESDITITGDPAGGTTIDASGGLLVRIFAISADATVELDHLTLTGGRADVGGAITSHGDLTVSHSTFTDNEAELGGAIENFLGTLTIVDSMFSGNGSSGYGGAIATYGDGFTMSGSVVLGNSATYRGGGLYIADEVVHITDSVFGSNSTEESGGAIYFEGSGGDDLLSITRTTIRDNTSGLGAGLAGNGALVIDRSTIEGNSASYGGGAIRHELGPVTITNSTIASNTAVAFGGAYYGTGGKVTISNSTIALNHAGVNAGGIELGSCCGATLSFRNALVLGNTSPDSPDLYGIPGTRTNSLIGIPAGFTLAQVLDAAGLADHGGPTETIALVGSLSNPARTTGDPAICAAAPVSGVDQRGLPRNDPCDMGAFEVQ